ncbi:hypothetical protein [Luteibacter aegosomatis]|nr:hypothetical protein [Luteibacter aegosomatis]
MHPYSFGQRSKYHAYTKENRRRIRGHVIVGVDVPFHERVVVDG